MLTEFWYVLENVAKTRELVLSLSVEDGKAARKKRYPGRFVFLGMMGVLSLVPYSVGGWGMISDVFLTLPSAILPRIRETT